MKRTSEIDSHHGQVGVAGEQLHVDLLVDPGLGVLMVVLAALADGGHGDQVGGAAAEDDVGLELRCLTGWTADKERESAHLLGRTLTTRNRLTRTRPTTLL